MSNNVYGFETLIKKNNINYSNRWKPLSIESIENYLNNSKLNNSKREIKKNIAYNYQYLEYLSFELNQLKLNNAIINSIIKNYIVIGSSIIEAIFYQILKDNNLYTKKDTKIIFTTKSNPIKRDNRQIYIDSNVLEKVEPYETEMTYDAMIKKIETKKLLSISHNAFPYIKKFRQLRNRVHLQIQDNHGSTEWWAFDINDYYLMKYILYKILTDEKIIGNNINLKKSTINCSEYLQNQIEIVKPKVILTLGYYPLMSLSKTLNFKIDKTLKETIKNYPEIKIDNLVIIPLYHPVAQVKKQEQLKQYKRIWKFIK